MVGIFSTTPAGLFSLLPQVSAARGLASAAQAAAGRSAPRDQSDGGIDRKVRQAEQKARNYSRLKGVLARNVNALEKVNERLQEVRKLLSDMRNAVTLAQKPTATDEEKARQASRFDEFLGKLNSRVKTAGYGGVNLIGSSIRDVFTTGELTFRLKPDSPTQQTISGTYLGSDYVVEAANGDTFYPDIYGSVMLKFPNPDADDDGLLVKDDDTIDYDAATGAIAYTHAGESTPYLSGTLTRKGLGVLHSALYGSFKDPAKLEDALADIDAATAKLRVQISIFESYQTQAETSQEYIRNVVDEHQDLATRLKTSRSVEEQTAALESKRQQLLFSSALQSTLSFNRQGILSFAVESFFDVEA